MSEGVRERVPNHGHLPCQMFAIRTLFPLGSKEQLLIRASLEAKIPLRPR